MHLFQDLRGKSLRELEAGHGDGGSLEALFDRIGQLVDVSIHRVCQYCHFCWHLRTASSEYGKLNDEMLQISDE